MAVETTDIAVLPVTILMSLGCNHERFQLLYSRPRP